MKSKEELRKMLFERLAELQDGRIKVENPEYAKIERTELALLYNILDSEDVPEQFWEIIECEISQI